MGDRGLAKAGNSLGATGGQVGSNMVPQEIQGASLYSLRERKKV